MQAKDYPNQLKNNKKNSLSNFDQSLSYSCHVGVEEFKKIVGALTICGNWSDKLAVNSEKLLPESYVQIKILLINVLELLFTFLNSSLWRRM